MTALKLRDAARRGGLLINAGVDPDSHAGRSWLRVESDGQIVFRAFWEPDAPDELAAVVSHGPWESKLMEASYAR